MSPQGIFILIFFTLVVLSVIWAQKNSPRQRHKTFRGRVSRELLQATKGDRELAERLLNHAATKYPGKTDRWYLEKVLYDLERDGAGGASSAREFRRNRQPSSQASPFTKWWRSFQRLFRR